MFKLLAKPILVAAGLVLGFSAAAVATPSNTVTINARECAGAGTGSVSINQTGAIGQSQGTFAFGEGSCAFGVQSRAGGGGVGILATLTQSPAQNSRRVTVFAQSIVEIILGPPDNFNPGDFIFVSISPHLNGVAFASIQATSLSTRVVSAALRAEVGISGTGESGAPPSAFSTQAAADANITAISLFADNDLVADSASLPNSLSPATIFIDPLEPILVRFSLFANLNSPDPPGTFAQSGVDAFNSLSFALSGPALNLPPGFTANSVSGQIVNNVFVGQGANVNGTQVPEPGALALFGIGLVGLGVMRRRRRAA